MFSSIWTMRRRCVECSQKSGESKHILAHLTTVINMVLRYLNIRLRHFHSDGGADLVAGEILAFLYKSGVTSLIHLAIPRR